MPNSIGSNDDLARDMEILELESRLQTQEQIIQHLTAECRKPWWRALGETAARLFWRARAKGMAKKNRELRWDRWSADMAVHDSVDALIHILSLAKAMEWESFEGAPTLKICPECHKQWAHSWSLTKPKHDDWCRIGHIVELAERAVRAGAMRLNEDPKRMMDR